MSIFASYTALVAGLILVLRYWSEKVTPQEFVTLSGLVILVASSVGLVIGMNEIANPLQFLALVAGVGVIGAFFFEGKRCQNP